MWTFITWFWTYLYIWNFVFGNMWKYHNLNVFSNMVLDIFRSSEYLKYLDPLAKVEPADKG